MDALTLWTLIGFLLAAYSVIANDSVQTLGTWIASNSEKFKWYTLWIASSFVLVLTLWYGWYTNDGDISYGRLDKIPYQTIEWYHAVAPLILVVLTRYGIPVSTTLKFVSLNFSFISFVFNIVAISISSTLSFARCFLTQPPTNLATTVSFEKPSCSLLKTNINSLFL